MADRGTPTLATNIDAGVRPELRDETPQSKKRLEQFQTPGGVAIHERLVVEEYMPLVRRLCRKFSGSGEPLEDLIQVGSIGLLRAIRKYDPTRANKFVTYAVPVIVGEIKNHLRDHGWAVKVPRKLQTHRLAVQRTLEYLNQALGRTPNIQDIAEATGLTQEEVLDTFEVGNYGKPLSLDDEYFNNDSKDPSSLIDYLGSDDPHFDRMSDRADLANILTSLDKRERAIIYMKFYAGLSQTQIANRLGLSQMHVSRLQRNALSKLKIMYTTK